MEGLDLNKVWELVLSSTKSDNKGSMDNSALTNVATEILSKFGGAASSTKTSQKSENGSSIDYIAIASQLMQLYNQYKGSADKTEAAAANNVKQVSDIISAMGGDKASMLSAAIGFLGKLFK